MKYSYDANGNLVSKGTSGTWDETAKAYEYENGRGEVYEYRYDLLNRLVGVEHSGNGTEGLTTIATYRYDMRDLRVSSTVKGTKTLRQYDLAGNLIWEDREDLDRRYVIALGGIWAESEIEGGNERTYWHHVDHLGTTEAITDEEGEVVWEANYGAFGEVLMSNGSKSFEPSYTGKEWESAIGLYYFNARWYDPELGRFITEDPARDGENWYGYCENNPLKYIDPDGRENGMPSDVETRITIHSEINRAFQLADSGAIYDDNADLAGSVVPMGLDQYDCSSELSAVTQLPLLSTAELANPDIRGQYYDDISEGQAQAGDWFLVRYTEPGTENQRGHVQMITGENAYADSIPATGPRITTNNPVDAYLRNNNVVPDLVVIIRPRRNQ